MGRRWDKLKVDVDDFNRGLRGLSRDADDPTAISFLDSLVDDVRANASEPGTSRPVDRVDAISRALGSATGALGFGVILAGPTLGTLPWGSPRGWVTLVVALIASGIHHFHDEWSEERARARSIGFIVILAAHIATPESAYNAWMNGLVLSAFTFQRPPNAKNRGMAFVLGTFYVAIPILITFAALVNDKREILPFSGAEPTTGNAVADALRILLFMWLIKMAGIQRRALRREQEEGRRSREEALAAERARIARELHDVVAHHVSVMTVQAEGARELLPDRPGKAVTVLDQISATGRDALTELRRMLGVLRAGEDNSPGEREPMPGIDRLHTLVAQTTAAGLPTQLRIEGAEVPLPEGVALSLYRIAQESLTNALKHAGPARATITLTYGAGAVVISVVDDGKGAPARVPSSGGHGLAGMKERVDLLGGELDAGPRRDGGFEVSARLPLEAPR